MSEETLNQALEMPCPFCGSTDLTKNQWSLEDTEVDAVECSDCYAGAPAETWIKRTCPVEIIDGQPFWIGIDWASETMG